MSMFTYMKTLLTSIALLVAPALAALAQFAPIADDFSNPGPLVGSTPDSGHGNWSQISSSSPALTVASGTLGLAASSGESAQLNFAPSNLSSGKIYMGWDFTVSENGDISTSSTLQAIAGFRSGTPGSGSFVLSIGVFRPSSVARSFSHLPSTTTSQVILGLFTGASFNASTSDLAERAIVLTRGVTYRAVLGVDLDTDEARLWINPVSIASSSIVIPFTENVRGIFFRQGGASHGEISIDNLVVSQDFTTAVTTSASPIPEPASSAVLIGLLGTSAVFTRRRPRNPASDTRTF